MRVSEIRRRRGASTGTPDALGWLALTSGLGFLALAAVTITKGVVPTFQVFGSYFWLNTYRNGIVRRGLVGTLLSPWQGAADVSGLPSTVLPIHIAAISLVLLACLVIGVQATSRLGLRMTLVLALFATSPFLGSITFSFGFYDGILGVEIIVGALLLRYGAPWWLLAGWLVIEALTHEGSFLITMLLVPVACIRLGNGQRLTGAVVGGLVGTVVVLGAGAFDPGLTAQVVTVGLPADQADGVLRVFSSQTVHGNLLSMAGYWLAHPARGLTGLIYTVLPAVAIMLLFWPQENWWSRLAYMVAALGPSLLLAIAWDVTRIASMSALSALLTVSLFTPREPDATGIPPWRVAAILALCLGYLSMPLIDMRLPHEARVINPGLVRAVCNVCADAGTVFAKWYGYGANPVFPPARHPTLDKSR